MLTQSVFDTGVDTATGKRLDWSGVKLGCVGMGKCASGLLGTKRSTILLCCILFLQGLEYPGTTIVLLVT